MTKYRFSDKPRRVVEGPEPTDDEIVEEFLSISDEVSSNFATLLVEQVADEFGVSDRRVLFAVDEYFKKEEPWLRARSVLGAISDAFQGDGGSVKSIPGYVYVFKAGTLFKIGKSNKPVARLKAMNRHIPPNGDKILPFMEFYVDRPLEVENMLHETFEDRHFSSETGGTEWFQLEISDIDKIKDLVAPHELVKP